MSWTPIPNSGYVGLTEDKYTELQDFLRGMGISEAEISALLGNFKHYADSEVWIAEDTDELNAQFLELDALDFYNGGWYLQSTKWVDSTPNE